MWCGGRTAVRRLDKEAFTLEPLQIQSERDSGQANKSCAWAAVTRRQGISRIRSYTREGFLPEAVRIRSGLLSCPLFRDHLIRCPRLTNRSRASSARFTNGVPHDACRGT